MTALVANFVGMTVSGTPGTGAINLGSAIAPGSISFATAYGQDTTVDLTYIDGANRACETGCVYNHASNTITRGYNETSTTGSVLSLTSSALVFVSWPASKVNAFNEMFINVGTNEIPIWELQATIIPRTDTIANLSSLVSGGGELCSVSDLTAIVQLNGTPGSGTVAYYSPMYPGTYNAAGQGSSSTFIPTHPWLNTASMHNFTIGGTYSDNTVKGGRLTLRGGNNTSTGHGGDVQLNGGSAGSSGTASTGGSVTIQTSSGYGTGTAGNILIQAGSTTTPINGEGYVRIRANGSTIIQVGPVTSTLGFYNATPITKPQVAGTGDGALTSLLSGLSNLGIVNISGVSSQYSLTAVKPKLLTFGQPQLLSIPQRTASYKITGRTYYVDPTVGGTGTGTFSDPYKAPTSATLAAGDGLLFKQGTTTTITAALSSAVSGTSNAPIIFGVYNGITGLRVTNQVGIATIDCNNAAIMAFYAVDRSYLCVEGLRFQNNSGANDLVKIYGNGSFCQILNCETLDGGTAGHITIHTTGNGHIIEGCKSTGAATAAITLQIAANDSTSRIQFNHVTNAGNLGIMVYDGYNNFSFSGTLACNTVENCGDSYPSGGAGIGFTVKDGAFKAFRNKITKCVQGITVVSSSDYSTLAGDFSGTIVQNNDISNCQFNISASGVFGSWVIEYNRLSDAGSYTGTAPVTASAYGRNIEIVGRLTRALYNPATTYVAGDKVSFAPDFVVYESLQNANTGNAPDAYSSTWWIRRGLMTSTRDGIIRFNYCSGAYSWETTGTPGSEGVGIGIDNYTMNVSIYGNICVDNEGNGIQLNSGFNNAVFGNLCIDNFKFRTGRLTVPREMDSAQIAYVLTPGLKIFNNTCISLGSIHQKYGISESYSGNPSTGGIVFNNLSIGASVSGIRLDNTGVSATENHNIVINSPAVVLDISGAATTPGTGTASSTEVITSEWYRPAVNGICDGTGVAPPGWALSLDGTLLSSKTPIGALHPQ